jgi:CubicO group peptidase (beta-lactamase class C family)
MRLLFGLCLALAAAAPLTAAAPVFNAPVVEAYVDGAMRQAMDSNQVAAATVAIVKDGQVLLAKGYGLARATPKPMAADADTLFQIASISKTPVYIAIGQLAEAGKLKFDDPVNTHLPPALRIPDQGFQRPILIRHLMTHSAGFEDSALGHLFVDKPERLSTLTAYLQKYRVNRVREPGVQTSYSNYSLALLGAVIEHVSKTDFPTYMETRILRPLGMLRSTYRDSFDPALGKRMGLPAPMEPAAAADRTQQLARDGASWKELGSEYTGMIAPAGGLHASANDMARYALALADPARLEIAGVLKAQTFATLLTPGVKLPGTEHHGFMHYWLGNGHQGFGHGGAMAFGASDLIIVPSLKLGIFVSTNGRGGFAFANDLVRRLLADFAPGTDAPVVRNAATKSMANEMAGDWIFNRRSWNRTEAGITVFDAGVSVTPQANGDILFGSVIGDTNRYEPIGDGVWRSVKRGSHLIFAKDANGTPTIWTGTGTGSAVRAGLFQRPLWLLILFGLTLTGATAATLRGLWTLRTTLRSPRMVQLADGATLATSLSWAIGLGGHFTVLIGAIADDGASLLFSYPGPMRWIAWVIAAAAGLSLVALVLSFAGGWAVSWAKVRRMALVLLFAMAALTSWMIGLAGFSGF